MEKLNKFGSLITAMVSPFDKEGELNLHEAASLAAYLERNANDALVLAGSTGESTSLTDEEKLSLFKEVSEAVNIPVIASTSGASTEHSVELTKKAAKLKIGGFLAVTPYYIRPPQNGIFEHFVKVAQAAENLPVILYDIPVRTGRKISRDTMLRLFERCENVIGVKDAAGNISETAKLIKELPEGSLIYSGDDALTFAMVSHGAQGVISVASHWVSVPMKEMISMIKQGELEKARAINNSLIDSFDFETSERFPNPLPTKAILRELGFNVGECRLPLGKASNELNELAKEFIERNKGLISEK